MQGVLSIQSNASIIENAAKQIEVVKSNSLVKQPILQVDDKLREKNEANKKREEFQKQVQSGEITPFEAITKENNILKTKGIFKKEVGILDLEKYLLQQAEFAKQKKRNVKIKSSETINQPSTKKRKHNDSQSSGSQIKVNRHCKRQMFESKKINDSNLFQNITNEKNVHCEKIKTNLENQLHSSIKKNETVTASQSKNSDSGSEYVPSEDSDESDTEEKIMLKKRINKKVKENYVNRILDDGDEDLYHKRISKSCYKQKNAIHNIDNLFKIPQSIWKRLYKYQKVSVQWLWELHGRNLGGLLGDEMGLGKTVQVIAFLAGLDCSELLSDGSRFRGLGPSLIICPATLMEQWVKHFHEWWPLFRVVILHQSGTYNGDIPYLLHTLKEGGILITSYTSVVNYKDFLIPYQWHYVILDEGHKIRNPEAKITKTVKQFSTPHRLLLSGSPMQNSLKELWSLFDFILPGKLGTLPAFLEHCANPITRGGYANASPLQEATALQVATILKDAITPYMIRRTKNDVQLHVSLPEKTEQVLFCGLTEEQKKLYKRYLRSENVSCVLHDQKESRDSKRYRAHLLVALSALRKICNHPDLYLYGNDNDSDEDMQITEEFVDKFGFWKRSGKMIVVQSLLKIWKKQGHRVLLFSQGRQMMHVLEALLQRENYSYLRMDGTTAMSQRQKTIQKFNNDPLYFAFLLTTRVGGLGVNLTGADRVIIYDPDWNPATDAQAKERAWRIGQSKRVTIYRLITAGTIEEKIYHRQIFKLLLSSKVLDDPRQHRLFKTTDLAELFNLNEPLDGQSCESEKLFHDSKLIPNKTLMFPSQKIEQMRKLATSLSKNIEKNIKCNNKCSNTDNAEENNSGKHNMVVTTNEEPNTYKTSRIEINEVSTCNSNNLTEINVSYTENEIINSTMTDYKNQNNFLNNNEMVINQEKNKSTISSINENNESQKLKKAHKCKKSQKQKSKPSALFEGERVEYLIGRKLGYPSSEPETTEDDNYVLNKLLSKSNVSSVFQHDSVLSNARKNIDDTTPMLKLARESAQESMEFVRKSRKWCWKPNWDNKSSEDT